MRRARAWRRRPVGSRCSTGPATATTAVSRCSRRTSRAHPNNKPQFTYMTNESDALAKIHAGLKPDLFRPYVGWVKYFATSGLVQPWNPKLIPNFKHLNPFMVKAGQYNGKQYGIPNDWGFDAILYRSDKVQPKAKSWGLLFDERYKGKIAWFDDLEMLVDCRPLPRVQEPVAPERRPAQAVPEAPHLEEAPRPHELVVRDRPVGGLRGRRHLDRLRVAQRLGADEGEETEGRLHAPEGEADRLGRHVHAAQGHLAASSSRTRTSTPGARRSRRSGSRTTTATATRTRWRVRARATCCVRCS